jgi:hypothetical protein
LKLYLCSGESYCSNALGYWDLLLTFAIDLDVTFALAFTEGVTGLFNWSGCYYYSRLGELMSSNSLLCSSYGASSTFSVLY